MEKIMSQDEGMRPRIATLFADEIKLLWAEMSQEEECCSWS